MSTCKFRPLGTKVVVEILPVESDSTILLPNGAVNPRTRQTFKVVRIGGQVNDEKFQLREGEVVLIAAHNSDFLPLSEKDQWALIDRVNIIAVVEKNDQN